jgi:PAS domain S-box-containing protein
MFKETLHHLKTIYDNAPDMYASISPETSRILYCNQTLLDQLNYSKEELINQSAFILYHSDALMTAKEVFKELIARGVIKNKELTLVTKDGRKIVVSLNANVIRDKQGKILYTFSSWREISDIQQSRLILDLKIKELDCIKRINTLQSYRQLSISDFLKQTAIAIKDCWLTDQESGVFLSCHGQTIKLGKTATPEIQFSEEIIFQEEVCGQIVFCLSKRDENLIQYHKSVLGNIRKILIEVIYRKQTDTLKTLLESAIKSTTDCIAIADPDGNHIYQNEALFQMLGYTYDEIKDLSPTKLYEDQDLAQILFETIKQGESWKGETNLKHKNGQIIPVMISADAIKNSNDEIIGLLGIHTDISERKKFEESEKTRQKQALKIFDAIDEMVYVADPVTYELIFTNQNLNKTIGQGKSLTGELCYKVLQGQNKPCEFCNNHRLFNKDRTDPITWEFKNSLNNRWYRCTDKKIKWFDGRELRMEIASDITEAKNTQLKLQESEERYRLATSASNNGIWDWWVKSDKVFYSDKWKAQLGYAPHELENTFENWRINLHPEDHDRMVNAVQEFLKNPQEYFIQEFRLKHKNGSYRWIRNKAAAVLSPKGEVLRMFGAHSDITDRKKAEEDLRKVDQMYRNMIQNAPDGMALIDYKGHYKFVSISGLKIFGYSMDEMLSMNSNEITHPNDQELKTRTIKSIINNKTSPTPTIEYRLLTKNKDYIWIESTFSKTIDQNGMAAIVINFRDISERKIYEERLIKARKKAETANIYKNQFLANMSHEIRTPMNGVVGFADLLKDKDLDEESRDRFLQIIDNNAKQLLTLIDDIINIAKIEADELKIIKSSFNLNELLLDLQNLFIRIKETKLSKNLDFILKIPPIEQASEIYSDQARLRQIISNLLGNALKFTDHGNITFGYSIEKDHLQFFVEDTGRGIPANKLNTIFERFQQTSSEDATIHGGTGLGLAICKGLVQLLGGQISVKSEPNIGSRFEFNIPLEFSNSPVEQEDDFDIHQALKQLNNKTILLAEDDPNIQFYYETIFEMYELNLIIANNGKEAVQLYKKHPQTDLVLMDIRMPELNGYQAAKQIIDYNPEVTIIAQTAYVMPDEKEKCMSSGCKDYLMKPIKKDLLLKTILKYI